MSPSMNPERLSWSGRLYRRLLLVYPKPFRDRFGRGMRHAFERDERAARMRGAPAYAVFWIATIWDTLRFSIAERRAFIDYHAHAREQGAVSMKAWFTIDWRDGWRSLRATPMVASIAVISIALGIGANTALFSILSALVLRPLPVRAPEQLVVLDGDMWTNPIWEALRARQSTFSAGGFAWSAERFDLSTTGETDLCDGLFASGGMFEVLGVSAVRGRTFTPADDDRSAPSPDGAVAVISHAFWQQRYHGAEDAIGRVISIDRQPFTIIGIMPPGFFGPEVGRSADLILPIAAERVLRGRESVLDNRQSWWLGMMFRLRDGQTASEATTALRAIQPQVRDETTPPNWRLPDQQRYLSMPMRLDPAASGRSELRTRYERPVRTAMAVVAVALLLACANVANLLLARAVTRRHELSVRLALGASRFRLSRQLFAESAIVTALGASLGLALAVWGSRALVATLTTFNNRVSLDLSLDWRVLGFTTAVSAATALFFGLAPTLGVSGIAPNDAIRERARGVAGDGRVGLRSALVVVQIALSLALVVAAGLFIRTFLTLTTRDAGFDRRQVLIASIAMRDQGTPVPVRAAALERIRTAVRAVPGVAHATVAFTTPVSDRGWNTAIAAPGRSLEPRQRMSWVNAVSPDWFATFGVRLLAGRDFDTRDATANGRVAIVNEAFAARFLDGDLLGKTFKEDHDPQPVVVVGVVHDTVYRSLRSPMAPTMFVPFKDVGGSVLLAVRTGGVPPTSIAREVARLVQRESPDAAVTFRSLEQQVSASLSQERLIATIAGVFGGLALILAGLGLYGVAAYTVSRRRAEIGIRMALGASPAEVVRMVVLRLAWMVAVGLAAGAAVSVWAVRFAGALLYGVQPRDPATLIGAVAVLSIVALAAGWLPARRASRIDPVVVLRDG